MAVRKKKTSKGGLFQQFKALNPNSVVRENEFRTIRTFSKALDPSSVVRESERRTIKKKRRKQ